MGLAPKVQSYELVGEEIKVFTVPRHSTIIIDGHLEDVVIAGHIREGFEKVKPVTDKESTRGQSSILLEKDLGDIEDLEDLGRLNDKSYKIRVEPAKMNNRKPRTVNQKIRGISGKNRDFDIEVQSSTKVRSFAEICRDTRQTGLTAGSVERIRKTAQIGAQITFNSKKAYTTAIGVLSRMEDKKIIDRTEERRTAVLLRGVDPSVTKQEIIHKLKIEYKLQDTDFTVRDLCETWRGTMSSTVIVIKAMAEKLINGGRFIIKER